MCMWLQAVCLEALNAQAYGVAQAALLQLHDHLVKGTSRAIPIRCPVPLCIHQWIGAWVRDLHSSF